MARQKNSISDEDWPEVDRINSYAIFMGYLLMGVRGLGLLVLTWTTVVLLGGFVSMLQKKDFWCLTVITLVQTAGVFDFLLKEKTSDLVNSLKGLLAAVVATVWRPFKEDANTPFTSKINKEVKELPTIARIMVAWVLLLVQVLVLAIVLCPLAVLYVLGLYISAGISLWRLIQHDYGDTDGGTNLKPALYVLYSLAVFQGAVYGYKTIYDVAARTGLVEDVAYHYSVETDLVLEYLDETVAGCMKDPSFGRRRNLVTYALNLLMESKSRYGYISGIMILGTILHMRFPRGQSGLLKQLLTGSASFSHVVQRLVETFGPTSPYSTEIRVRAARIAANVAGSINLEQFPARGMMIQCISSLLDTSEDYRWRPERYVRRVRRLGPMGYGQLPKVYERDWLLDNQELWYSSLDEIPSPTAADSKTQESGSGNPRLQSYKELVVHSLRILEGLAVNEDNCRVISNTQGLVSKAMAPLVSDQQLHSGDHHDEWCSMAEESLELTKRLMTAPGETKTSKLPCEILVNNQVIISTLERIVECLKCQVLLKRQAVEVLLDLSPASIMLGGSRSTMFLWILLHISLLPDYHFDRMCGSTHLAKKSSYIAASADEKLQAMLSSETEVGVTSMLRSDGGLIGSLARTVAGAGNNAYRIHAATILEHLCVYYTNYDDILKQLKKAMTDVMPEVLTQIVHRPTREEILEASTDLEHDGVSSDNNNAQESSSTSRQEEGEQDKAIQLQEQKALIQLCFKIYYNWLLEDQNLTCEFDGIAAKVSRQQHMPDKTFITLIEEANHYNELLAKDKQRVRVAAVLANSSSET